ncbi:MAG: HAMP domain-containing sensor histidine kinase, partial [Phycisphaerales bacterium]
VEGEPVNQGVWLNWQALRSDLLASVEDVLPGSSLVPVPGSAKGDPPGDYQLATIPAAFVPPPAAIDVPWTWSPATAGLLVTWIAILATIIAVGAVLRAAIVLSQRRGRFVSAVTHELRTPLTTFRLYSQMLADGMVTDEQVRRDYLTTLKRESERLTGIVENVLEYARLTRQRAGRDKPAGVQTLSPGALVARFRPALARRVGQSNLDLVVSMDLDAHQDRTVTVDPHGVERIMMNLIENACKYAAPAEDPADDGQPGSGSTEDFDTRIHLDVGVRDDNLELLVADHGPGIAPGEGSRIFGEFQRGSRGLGNARSGLGLGLALSRGLAREMGGDLNLTRRRNHGAEFLLTIPLDEA